jgi:hypothetical protein
MKTENTLRYLLLRHLKKLERQVPRDLFLEVTRSLHVAVDRHSYVVTWQARGERHEKTFARTAFNFYRRGDTAAEARDAAEDLATENDSLAAAFAREALGSAPASAAPSGEPLEPYAGAAFVEALVLALAVAGFGGLGLAGALGVAALVLVEIGHGGRLRSAAVFLLLAVWGPPFAAALGAGAYALLQFLDPDSTRRRLRVAVSLLATLLALARAASPALGWSLLPVALLAALLAASRSLLGSHHRAVPLALPFYALGLRLDGSVAGCISTLAVVGGGTLAAAYLHGWLPLQRERTLTPNG